MCKTFSTILSNTELRAWFKRIYKTQNYCSFDIFYHHARHINVTCYNSSFKREGTPDDGNIFGLHHGKVPHSIYIDDEDELWLTYYYSQLRVNYHCISSRYYPKPPKNLIDSLYESSIEALKGFYSFCAHHDMIEFNRVNFTYGIHPFILFLFTDRNHGGSGWHDCSISFENCCTWCTGRAIEEIHEEMVKKIEKERYQVANLSDTELYELGYQMIRDGYLNSF